MSFRTKLLRCTLPAVIALCVLLLAVRTMFRTNEPPEPKRVYVMPERSINPPPVNTGGLPLEQSMTSNYAATTESGDMDSSTSDSSSDEPGADDNTTPPPLSSHGETEMVPDTDARQLHQARRDELNEMKETLARIETELSTMNHLAAPLIEAGYDQMASHLSGLSLKERQDFLATFRQDLEKSVGQIDPADDVYTIDEFVDEFVKNMNARGVYFE